MLDAEGTAGLARRLMDNVQQVRAVLQVRGSAEGGQVLGRARNVYGSTLWELATVVIEEVDKVVSDEVCARDLAREILIHIIQDHVRNMEVIGRSMANGGLPGVGIPRRSHGTPG